MASAKKPKFTTEQKRVIDSKGRNLLVSAAAGSGKTAVLVERIIQKILDEKVPLDIDRLLVVTFTDAAASEMRERIGKAIDEKLQENPENVHLQRQSALLYRAQISTIHSFCMNVIKNNFNIIGLDPAVRVANDTELKLMMEDVLDELFEEKYKERNEEFLYLTEYFGKGCSDSPLREIVLKLYGFSEGYPFPEEWFEQCINYYDIHSSEEFNSSPYIDFLLEHMKATLDDVKKLIENARELLKSPGAPEKYINVAQKDYEDVVALENISSYDDAKNMLDDFKFASLTKLSGEYDAEIAEKFKELREEYKGFVTGKKAGSLKNLFLTDSKTELNKVDKIAIVIQNLIKLTEEFSEEYSKRKIEKCILSFSDMEKYALNILCKKDENGVVVPTKTALEYADMFDEIMMDEYQDCNRVQELLISSIAKENALWGNRFMVGDVKQSIYKFRLANPELFIEKYRTYNALDYSSQSCFDNIGCERIDLHKNFRSRRNVVNSVNDLFGQIMTERVGGVAYDHDARLVYGAGYPHEEVSEDDIYTSDPDPDYDTEILFTTIDSESDYTKGEKEAELILSKILELKNSLKVVDKDSGELRPLKYSDIVILVRSMGETAKGIKKVFSKTGVPVHMTIGAGFFDAREVQSILQLLKVVDNPLQDIPLYGALTSFFGGLSEEEIAEIKITSGSERKPLYEDLMAVKNTNPKVRDFLEYISILRKEAVYTPIHLMIMNIVMNSGYIDYLSALPGGDVRRSNIFLLIEQAKDFEATNYKGLFNFVRYISKIKKINSDLGEADVLDENANVVKVMTIHKSKGLEFPVCFLAEVHKDFNFQDLRSSVVYDMDFGLGISYIDTEKRIKNTPLFKRIVNMKMTKDIIGEELRILYVALTRAKEKLIITGVLKDEDAFNDLISKGEKIKEEGSVSFTFLISAKKYLDFLVPLSDSMYLYHKNNDSEAISYVDKVHLMNSLMDKACKINNEDGKVRELLERTSLSYSHSELEGLILKTSVSELKKAYIEDLSAEEMFPNPFEQEDKEMEGDNKNGYIPSFAAETEKQISGTDRGSAYHKVMELLDFEDLDIKSQINLFEKNQLLSKEWARAVSDEKIMKMVESSLGKRMAKAQRNGLLYREQPFVLGLSANRVKEFYPPDETVLLQGIIDAFFVEDGQIVLMDYKTDKVSSGDELIKRYSKQLDCYEEALNRITGKTVKEIVLYSFALNKEVVYIK